MSLWGKSSGHTWVKQFRVRLWVMFKLLVFEVLVHTSGCYHRWGVDTGLGNYMMILFKKCLSVNFIIYLVINDYQKIVIWIIYWLWLSHTLNIWLLNIGCELSLKYHDGIRVNFSGGAISILLLINKTGRCLGSIWVRTLNKQWGVSINSCIQMS